MPSTIDNDMLSSTPEAAARLAGRGVTPLVTLDPTKPPVKQIPHMDFPVIVYKHPKEPFRKVEHRNQMREIVQVEMVANEHLTRKVACLDHLDKLPSVNDNFTVTPCKNCAAALKQATSDGWELKPYIPMAAPDPMAGVYEVS